MKYEEMNKSELLMEVFRLKKKLDDYEQRFGALEEEEIGYLGLTMTKEEKLRIFMDYFSGRQDAVSERYISKKDGKKHYSLGCLNKFDRAVGCDIERTHCKNCPSFVPRPYDESAVLAHMNDERRMIGIFPILPGNYVRFLVFDLDEASYHEDANRLRSTLYSLGVESVLERSQSGHGIHLWVFFEEKIKASDARKIANYVLTEAMDRYGGFDFKSYDRVFPNQDKLDKDGYGNCIGLPLNKQCVEDGNTAFLKADFSIIKKPIEYLSTVRKISKDKAKELLEFASSKDEYGLFGENALQKMALSADDFQGTVHLHYAGDVYIPLLELTTRSMRFLARITSVLNKEYFKLLNARKSVYNVPRVLSSYKMDNRYFRLPRGYKEPLLRLFKAKGIPYEYSASLQNGVPIALTLKLTLRPEQVTLLEKAKNYDSAIIAAPTGFGKTLLGAALIQERAVNALILVPSVNLLQQWVERLEEYIEPDYPYKKRPFGYLSGSGDRLNGFVDVATVQSLVRNEEFRKKAKTYGLVIIDEAHHMAAYKFEEALRELAPKYLYGLTATPERSDEREEFIYRSIGPLVELERKTPSEGFIRRYHPRFTKFSSLFDGADITSLFADVTRDEERNRLIVEDVLKTFESGGVALVLTERIEHARILFNLLRKHTEDVAILYGGQDKAERRENQERIASFGSSPFIVISIGKFIGEGFDDERFNALFITYPFRWKGILAQYCGRLQRKATAFKQVDVFDYVDPLVPAFSKMYSAREKGYYELGYKLVGLDPAYHSEILDAKSFEAHFSEDLKSAKKSVLCFIAYAHEDRVKRILPLVTCPYSLVVSGGVDVGNTPSVIRVGESLPNVAIIDDRIIYYGGINPFCYGQKDDTIMRIEDPTIAKDIRDTLLSKTQ